jgi:hypothetical protein
MSANIETQYHTLLQEIRLQSPRTSVWLEQIYKNYGTQAGCYASVAIVWLHARIEFYGEHGTAPLSEADVQSFTYFQEMKKQPEALALFRNMLQTYLIEQQTDSDEHASGEYIDTYAAKVARTFDDDNNPRF